MTEKKQIEELIERLEKAQGPDRELDQAIAVIVRQAAADAEGKGRKILGVANPNPYTSSIDSALTLVPEGYFVTLEICPSNSGVWHHAKIAIATPYEGINAPNSAIALCIASLRARLASHE